MSVSKYLWTEECEGKPCVGDCDFCKYLEKECGDEADEYKELAVKIGELIDKEMEARDEAN